MRRFDLVNLWNVLSDYDNVPLSSTISFKFMKTKKMIEDEIMKVRALNVYSPEFIAYDKERVKMAMRFCEKDVEGNPKIFEGEYVLTPSNMSKFQKELSVLREEHKEAIDKQIKQSEDAQKLMEEEVKIEGLPMFKHSDFDGVKITPNQIELFFNCHIISEE